MLRAERGQSEVIGFVLILGLTVIVVGSTLALGSVALSDSQSTAELERAEQAMTEVDSKMSLVAHGQSTSQAVSFDEGDGELYVEEAGRIEIAKEESGETVLNESLNALVFEADGTRIAYQGGGVWRLDDDRGTLVSPPEFHYRGETLTVPLVNIDRNATVDGGEVVFTSEGLPERHVEENPIVENVTVTVSGDYHEGWADYFASRTDTRIVDRGDDSVTVVLQSELSGDGVSQSMGSLGSSEFDLENVESLTADSYDSAGAGPGESRHNAVIATSGEVDAPQGGQDEYVLIKGDLEARDDINPNPSGIQSGDHPINVTGEVRERTAIDEPDPVDGYLAQAYAEYDDRYDVDPTETYGSWDQVDDPETDHVVVENGLDVDGDDETYRVEDAGIRAEGGLSMDNDATLTLEADERSGYEFDDLDVQGSELVLDTTDGDLDLYVDGSFAMDGDADADAPGELTVRGDGEVYVYVRDDVTLSDHVNVSVAEDAELRVFQDAGDAEVSFDPDTDGEISSTTGPSEPANGFWIFSNAQEINFHADDGSVDLTATLYAPGTVLEEADGDVAIRGALVVDSFEDISDAELVIRYDEALADAEVFDEIEQVPTITYLHVSTQEVVIEDG